MADDDRLTRKLAADGEVSDTPGSAASDAESDERGERDQPDVSPRDPESGGNEDLRVPGEDS